MPEERREGQLVAPQEMPKSPEAMERTPAPEQVPVPEQPPAAPAAVAVPTTTPVPAPVAAKDAYRMQIERVLEDGLADLYLSLQPETRSRFRRAGDETAAAIRAMLEQATVKLAEIAALIRKWLRIIPAINRYYLEQEAKIKTDKIALIAETKQRDSQKV